MLGYVITEKAELKIKEYELYSAYYCGLCKATGRKYGQLPRFSLNYDFVFLALLLASITEETDCVTQEHCIVHPVKKKSVVKDNVAIDYASDIMVLLAYYKLKDDYYDKHSIISGALAKISRPALGVLFQKRPELCTFVEASLSELSKLEKECCPSLDQAADPFSKLMEQIFSEAWLGQTQDGNHQKSQSQKLIFGRMGYHLGKWIYLMDALDDIEENIKDGNYNPLLYRYEYKRSEDAHAFRRRIHDATEYNLLFCLSELSKAWELSDTKKHKGIISNILYMGMLRKTEQLLEKGTTTDDKSL